MILVSGELEVEYEGEKPGKKSGAGNHFISLLSMVVAKEISVSERLLLCAFKLIAKKMKVRAIMFFLYCLILFVFIMLIFKYFYLVNLFIVCHNYLQHLLPVKNS
jgi:hypothetical protein